MNETISDKATDIRPLHEEELPAALTLVWDVFTEFEAPDYTPQGVETFRRFIAPETFVAQYRSRAIRTWGAFRDKKLVGVLATRNGNHISLLFVDKDFHRQGIARALLLRVYDHCRTFPTTKITVNSSPYAVEAYRRLGFAASDTERTVDGIRFTPMEYLL